MRLWGWWRKRPEGVPETIMGYSPWAEDYNAHYEEHCGREPKRQYEMPYWDVAKNYIRHSVGDVVPMLRGDYGVAHYRITKVHQPSMCADLLMSDDGKSYDLVFEEAQAEYDRRNVDG